MTADVRGAEEVEVSVAIVGYGAPGLLDRCLASVAGAGAPSMSHEVLLVDNASPVPLRGSLRTDLDAFPAPLTFVELERNVGFGAACDHLATKARGRWLLLLNPDAEVLPGAVDALVAFAAADPSRGIVGGRTVTVEGELDPTSVLGAQTLGTMLGFATGLSTALGRSRVFGAEPMAWWARDSVREVGVVTGAFLVVPLAVHRALGGFGRSFFMYGEDADLCRRARAVGYRPSFTPEATVVHVGGGTATSSTSRLLMVLRGKATLARVGRPAWYAAAGRALLTCGVAWRAAAEGARAVRGARVERYWREAWARRAAWLPGWAESDTPDTVETKMTHGGEGSL